MKKFFKRFSAAVLSLAVALTAVVFDVPGKLFAKAAATEEAAADRNCNGDSDHSSMTPWSKTDSLPEAAGSYYLTENVNLSEYVTISKDITLCLNGCTVTSTDRVLYIDGSTLTLCDCTGSGALCGNGDDTVKVESNGGTFNMNGGKIYNLGSGVGVSLSSALRVVTVFNMRGGEISGCSGSGVLVNKGTFNMYGGTINDNFTNFGGGVRIDYNNGTFNMYGGTISNNRATGKGGGVYLLGKFNMYGGTISNNEASGVGGGVYLDPNNAEFTIDGAVTIANNTSDGQSDNNVEFLMGGRAITIGNNFSPENRIGVNISYATLTSCERSCVVASKNPNVNIIGCFTSDTSAHQVYYSDGKAIMTATHSTLVKHDAVEPDCEVNGNPEYYLCSKCKKKFSAPDGMIELDSTIINKTGHAYGELNVTLHPTLTTPGKATSVCENNNSHTTNTTIPKLTDITVWTKTDTPAPTIKNDGKYTFTSEDYGTETVDVPKLSNTEVWTKDEATKPTKDDDGLYTYTSDYGTVTVDVPKLTDPTIWTIDEHVDPTEDAPGKDVYTSVYGEVEVTLDQLPHTHAWGKWTITKAPTETKTGTAERTCTKDNEHKDTVTLPVLTDTSVWTKQTDKHIDPTEESTGKDVYTSDYGEVEVTLPELGHTHTLTYVPEVPATETKEGTKEHWHCGGCDKDFADKDGEVEVTESDLIIPVIKAEVTVGENAPQVTTDRDELIEAVDIDDVEDSSEIKITLIVEDASETVTEQDKLAAEEALTELDGFKMGQYIDISLIMETITGSETTATAITETKKPLTITLTIPSDLLGKAEYSVIRVHEGEVTVLEDMDDDPATVTIQTDKFSTYALAYIEKANDDTPPDENNSGSSDTTSSESEPTDSEGTPSGNGGTSDSDTASPSDDNSSNNESGDNSDNSNTSDDNKPSGNTSNDDDNNYKPSENDPTDNNHGNPATGVAVSLLPLAAAVIVLTVTAKRKKK